MNKLSLSLAFRNKNRGVTLVELLVAVGLSFIILTAGLGYYFNIKKQQSILMRKQIMTQKARIATLTFANIINNAGMNYCTTPTDEEYKDAYQPFLSIKSDDSVLRLAVPVPEEIAIRNLDIRAGLETNGVIESDNFGDGEATKLTSQCGQQTMTYYLTTYKFSMANGRGYIKNFLHKTSDDPQSAKYYQYLLVPNGAKDNNFKAWEWGFRYVNNESDIYIDNNNLITNTQTEDSAPRAIEITARMRDPEGQIEDIVVSRSVRLNNAYILEAED